MKLARRFVRLIWLAALLLLNDRVLYADYRRRFRVPMHGFRRDARMLRRKASYIDALMHRNYRRQLSDSHLK
jgi:hypothetical protein